MAAIKTNLTQRLFNTDDIDFDISLYQNLNEIVVHDLRIVITREMAPIYTMKCEQLRYKKDITGSFVCHKDVETDCPSTIVIICPGKQRTIHNIEILGISEDRRWIFKGNGIEL